MLYDELYRYSDETMLSKALGYALIALNHLHEYKNLNELAKRKSFLSRASYANEAKQELEFLEGTLEEMAFYMDFQLHVNDPLDNGEELDDYGRELKARWDEAIEDEYIEKKLDGK